MSDPHTHSTHEAGHREAHPETTGGKITTGDLGPNAAIAAGASSRTSDTHLFYADQSPVFTAAAEQAVLGSCLLRIEAYDEVSFLEPDEFLFVKHRWIWNSLVFCTAHNDRQRPQQSQPNWHVMVNSRRWVANRTCLV